MTELLPDVPLTGRARLAVSREDEADDEEDDGTGTGALLWLANGENSSSSESSASEATCLCGSLASDNHVSVDVCGVSERGFAARGLNSNAATFSAGDPERPGAGEDGRLPFDAGRTVPLEATEGPTGVLEALDETVRCHRLGEARGLPSIAVPPLLSVVGSGLVGSEPTVSLDRWLAFVGVVGRVGVHGRVSVVLELARKLAGRGRERGEAGNGEGLGEVGGGNVAPVGLTSSR